MGSSLHLHVRTHLRTCGAYAQTGIRMPAQEAPHGGQAIRDLRSPLTVMCLKVGEHKL
jgi:hypothetical protein